MRPSRRSGRRVQTAGAGDRQLRLRHPRLLADTTGDGRKDITGQLPDEAVNRLRERFRVTQSASPRVFLGRGQPDRGWPPGVHVFSTADVPDEILRALDRAESLFVSAWRLRRRGPKQRRGDGVDWDAFEPPR